MAGLIDWMTLILSPQDIPESLWLQIRERFPCVVQKCDTMTGEVFWSTPAYENVRSDSHQIVMKCGGSFIVQGSPARLFDKNNVFGSASVADCADKMIRFAAKALGVILPLDLTKWGCTRIDFTCNYLQQSQSEVDEILRTMSMAESCRQARATYENGVTFGAGSTLHMGVVYGKGKHLRMQVKKGKAEAQDNQLKAADKIIRLEYRMRKKWLTRNINDYGHWSKITEKQLIQYHADYFSKFISNYEIAEMDRLLDYLKKAAPTERQAQAAYDCYMRIRELGYVQAKSTYKKPTFYRHLKHLKLAGLTESNFVQSSVVPIGRKTIELGRPVNSWAELLNAS